MPESVIPVGVRCRSTSVFPGDSEANSAEDTLNPVKVAVEVSKQRQWEVHQSRDVRSRFLIAAAAMLLIGVVLVTATDEPNRVAAVEQPVSVPTTLGPTTSNESQTPSMFSSMDLSGLWPHKWSDNVSDAAYNNLTSLGDIDLVALIPEQHSRVVQGIPATINSMEPIYRYSSDIPLLNQWSSGINYTIGLIQNSLSIPESKEDSSEWPQSDDLGQRVDLRLANC